MNPRVLYFMFTLAKKKLFCLQNKKKNLIYKMHIVLFLSEFRFFFLVLKSFLVQKLLTTKAQQILFWRHSRDNATKLGEKLVILSRLQNQRDDGNIKQFSGKFHYALTSVIICREILQWSQSNLFFFAVSTAQYAHYVFNAIDRDSNGSVSFEVICY